MMKLGISHENLENRENSPSFLKGRENKTLENNTNKAERVIKDFVLSFWKEWAKELLRIFDDLRGKDAYSWLTDSDLLLMSYKELASNNSSIKFEEYSMKMLELVMTFQELKWKAENRRKVFDLHSWISDFADVIDKKLDELGKESGKFFNRTLVDHLA